MSAYGGKPCSTKTNVHFKALYESIRIGGPHHKTIQPPSPSKKKLLTNQRQIQGSKGQMTYQTKQNFRGTQRSNTRAHLSVVQRKEGPRGPHLGSADPLGRPTPWVARPPAGPNEAHLSPAYSHHVSYAGSWWYHLERSPNVPPLEGYIRRRRAPN